MVRSRIPTVALKQRRSFALGAGVRGSVVVRARRLDPWPARPPAVARFGRDAGPLADLQRLETPLADFFLDGRQANAVGRRELLLRHHGLRRHGTHATLPQDLVDDAFDECF